MNILNSDNNETYYSLLNVEQTASPEEIKRSYRKLSLELHPDRNKGNIEKSEKYKKITLAYNTLGDLNKRAQYDMTLSFSKVNLQDNIFMNMLFNPIDIQNILSELKPNNFKFHHNIPMDIFSNFEKSSFLSPGINNYDFKSRPQNIYITININLFDAYNGCKKPINIKRWIYENNRQVEQEETIYVDIPKGIDNNEIIIIQYKGNYIGNQNKGNVEVKIIIENNTVFERDGIDLIFKKNITLKDSLCGFSFDLCYIDGREFKINSEPGNIIQPNFRKTIPKFGMTRDTTIGDLIIIFDVIYPKTFSETQIKELSNLL